VQFSVYSAISGDLGVFISVPAGSGSELIAPFGISGNTSYFRIQLGAQPGTLPWTVLREDCKLGGQPPNCTQVVGPTWDLTVVAPPTSVQPPPTAGQPPRSSCRRGFTPGVIGGRHECLHAGEFCARRYARRYRRYGFVCILVRRHYRLEHG
jgi:hypothetical protein